MEKRREGWSGEFLGGVFLAARQRGVEATSLSCQRIP